MEKVYKTSEARRKNNAKYDSTQDKILVRVAKGTREAWKAKAEHYGISLNALIVQAVADWNGFKPVEEPKPKAKASKTTKTTKPRPTKTTEQEKPTEPTEQKPKRTRKKESTQNDK